MTRVKFNTFCEEWFLEDGQTDRKIKINNPNVLRSLNLNMDDNYQELLPPHEVEIKYYRLDGGVMYGKWIECDPNNKPPGFQGYRANIKFL